MATGLGDSYRRFGAVIEKLAKTQGWTSKLEKKWATVGSGVRTLFCQIAAKELSENPNLYVTVSICQKAGAPECLRSIDVEEKYPDATGKELLALKTKFGGRSHLLYSHLVADVCDAHLPPVRHLSFCPDELNGGQRVLDAVLAYRLLIMSKRAMTLTHIDRQRALQNGSTFADMVSGAVWEAYEQNDEQYLKILQPLVKVHELYCG